MNKSLEICWCEEDVAEMSPTYSLLNMILVIVLIPLISLMGICGNSLSIAVYRQLPMRLTSVNLYLSYLGMSDIAVDVGGILLIAADSARRFSPLLNSIHLRTVAYYLPFCYVAQTCSVYFTVLAAFDCYISVCWPSFKGRFCQPKVANRSAFALMLLSLVYNVVLFKELEIKVCQHNETGEILTQVCPTEMRIDETYIKVYKVYMYAFFMAFAPFIILLVLNTLIIAKLWRLSRQLCKLQQPVCSYQTFAHQRSCIEVTTDAVHIVTSNAAVLKEQTITVKSTCANCGSKSNNNNSDGNGILTVKVKSSFNRQTSYSASNSTLTTPLSKRSYSRANCLPNTDKLNSPHNSPATTSKRKAKNSQQSDGPLMLVMVVALFLICNSVALVVNIFEATISDDHSFEPREDLSILIDVGSFLVVFNSSANFLIYLIFSKQFRKVLKKLLNCHRSVANGYATTNSNSSASVEEENSLCFYENYDTTSPGLARRSFHESNHNLAISQDRHGCFSRDTTVNDRGMVEIISFVDQSSPELSCKL